MHVGSKRKRSILLETTVSQNDYTWLHDNSIPLPFDLEKELKKAHRHRRGTTSTQRYILFMLDTSGSIGNEGFTEVKDVLHEFIPLFCSEEIKFAVMTFSHIMKQEICFKCQQGNQDKNKVKLAVKSIKYRGGGTDTGTAAQCACSHMLSSACGYFPRRLNPPSIDVLFFTDGKSNGPVDVCDAVRCFENFRNINVFTIGIGSSIRQSELRCIVGNLGDRNSAFFVSSFDQLTQLKDLAKGEADLGICYNRP